MAPPSTLLYLPQLAPPPLQTESVHATASMMLNPYVAGKSLSGDCGFFGRKDIFDIVQTELPRNAIVLFGQRRIGKTSILKQLQRRLPKPFLPVYFDLMDRAEQPMGQLLTDLAQLLAAQAGLPPLAGTLDDSGEQFRQHFLPELYRALGTEHAMVLLLDEFDVLDGSIEEQLPATAAARYFFPYLRRLIETERRLHFLVVIGRKTEELSSDFKATFKAAKFKRVSVLSGQDARDLVTLAEQQGSLRFSVGVVDALLQLTNGHPYLTQLLCQQLWDAAHLGAGDCVPVATQALLDQVIPKALEAGQNVFEWIWDGLPPAERVMLAAVAEATEGQPAVTEEQVVELLQRHGVRVLSGDLELAPRKLVEWELLRNVQGGYCCHVELLRRWVLTQKPLPKVKEEVYRLNPLADRLFLSAKDFYALEQPVKAQDHLLDVLQLNPGHLPARLLLAKLLQERGKHAEAVQELEKAWTYDQAAARMPFLGALIAAGEIYERHEDLTRAVEVYARVLKLNPDEPIATERLLRLRQRQAMTAAAAGETKAVLEQLRLLSAEAGPPAPRLIGLARVVALNSEAQQDWDTALQAYRWLEEKTAGEDRWNHDLARVISQKELAHYYQVATEAMQKKAWDQAVEALAQVVAIAPAYRDAARLLATAIEQPDAPAYTGLIRLRQADELSAPWLRPRTGRTSGIRRLLMSMLLGAALSLGGVSALGFLPPSAVPPGAGPTYDPDRLLLEAERDAKSQRWVDAMAKFGRLLDDSTASDLIRQSATKQLERAKKERAVQQTLLRLERADDGDKQALAWYRDIPRESVYYAIAKESYDQLLPQYVARHLQAAESARTARKCDEFRTEIQEILLIEPKQASALRAKDLPCEDAKAPSEIPRRAAKTTSARASTLTTDKTEKVLTEAAHQFVNGNFAKTIALARSVVQASPARSWRYIGAAACNLKDSQLANESFRRLDSEGRRYVVYICRSQGVSIFEGRQLTR